ncbi:hypothetical protein HRR83_007872 [Exophiala dermatitidis]|nr:hypothetical protein HRR74_007473 [Exophiala dermatitidis]KAJ4510133.1 hypothetical protein HRR73_006931 [Exophiala dermatitidis]KAJ4590858.1 hypothetical protein HRR83_007872 [Exophiala dermatitidis]KAJ4592097.1 hypothetical protein HRR84_007202 [Exophiala dermatitidis]KAJ4641834.1 hypothetical protein HRR89_003706 [Exophiala dermatitidis]
MEAKTISPRSPCIQKKSSSRCQKRPYHMSPPRSPHRPLRSQYQSPPRPRIVLRIAPNSPRPFLPPLRIYKANQGHHQTPTNQHTSDGEYRRGTRLRFTLSNGKAIKAEVVG